MKEETGKGFGFDPEPFVLARESIFLFLFVQEDK